MKAVKDNQAARTLLIMLADAVIVMASGGLALLVRFDFSFGSIPHAYLDPWVRTLPIQIAVTLAVFRLRRMYRYLWRYVSARDVLEMASSVCLAYAAFHVPAWLLGYRQPRSVLFIELLCQMFLLIGIRCSIRFFRAMEYSAQNRQANGERIMLIGAGEAGRMLLREIATASQLNGTVCCVIDDDPAKQGKFIENAPVVGGRDNILEMAAKERITQIILAIPAAPGKQKKEILNICQQTGCRVRSLPGIYQLVNGEVSLAAVKDVQVEDLLGRDPVKLDTEVLRNFLENKTVLVTGGGGSIGSELCRQIAKYRPKRLIILDIYENNAYDIQQELRRTWGSRLDLRVEIASIRDGEKIDRLFQFHRPDIVFHAAAHKHVPLMEECPEEAVKNNIFGTYHVIRASEKFGVRKFVMISTDKAVNPTNCMGATKRFCEMILQSKADSPTEFCAVRFGNVLGSNGSVVPLFKRQIEEGGPVTITDKRIIRYFMTIPEAAQLVMEAGAMAKHSQIFVLDMGEPVKILTLAENLIRLSGLEPYKDIDIQEVGLRPGEKLYEELLMRSENLSRTSNEKIFIEQQHAISQETMMDDLARLDAAIAENRRPRDLIALLREMIPTYRDPEEVNSLVAPPEAGEEQADSEAYSRNVEELV
ncbi:polysaccharide biosynthesis protein [Oscillibacter valericigenes]|uniref:polysaccharide biosynthesis protein n=1 Tax=Oscillibacter valericigenes TaxID=351091 RepID=UPI001F3F5A76|nr:nucleoside-diphosphate sugar epimerase/dehydratase [Oscillibacter valericigenes]MCF2616131.1 polysaccharide biosynthesis protein [Oscillibacter valericigenes]